MNRRSFLWGMAGLASASGWLPEMWGFPAPDPDPGFRLADVTSHAGIQFHHNSGAYGGKLLPETLGSGCAFLDYDADGWQDILLINGMDWPGHKRQRSTLHLYRNNRNGTFTDVTSRRSRCRNVWHGRGRGRLQQRWISRHSHHLRGTESFVQEHRQGHVCGCHQVQRVRGAGRL